LEPYRMFTSRAEFRLHLREDNADQRLTELGYELGCVEPARYEALMRKREAIETETSRLAAIRTDPNNAVGRAIAEELGVILTAGASALELLRRPELNYANLTSVVGIGPAVANRLVAEQVEVSVKYAGYLERQRDEIERNRRHEDTMIPTDFDYAKVHGLSNEVLGKLQKITPQTIAQAQRISGVTPVAISLLLVHLKRHSRVA
ncbi:MAG: tRNA uridine-5-carboxymethylaminomethyl(34) synthesis enzyme MnmG, partial [Dokdonella sp.]